MPTVTEQVVQGWGSCRDLTCPGYKQKPADVVLTTTAYTYFDGGARDSATAYHVERTSGDVYRFADDAEADCGVCGKPRIPTNMARPEYAPLSGQDESAILGLNHQGQIRDERMRGLERDAEVARMQAREAERDAREVERDRSFEEMKAELDRRKGGRPRKDPEGE